MVLKEKNQIFLFLSLPDFEIKIRDYHVLLPYPSGPAIYLHSWWVNIAIFFTFPVTYVRFFTFMAVIILQILISTALMGGKMKKRRHDHRVVGI